MSTVRPWPLFGMMIDLALMAVFPAIPLMRPQLLFGDPLPR